MRALVLVSLMVGSLVSVARADVSDDARTAFQHGTALYALHRFAEAAVQFEKAFELKPDPAILYNAAQAHRFAGNKPRALELYESYVRMYSDQPNATEVREHVRQLRAAIEAEHSATNAPPSAVAPLPSATAAPAGRTPSTTEPSSAPAPSSTPAAQPSSSATTLTASAAPPERPLVKKPWFWAVVGGAAVVVAAGVVLGVTLGSSTKDPSPTYGVANGN
jgi:tetratricopeptide (TPR) repeat protein